MAVCGDSSPLSAFCTGSRGPCSEEIGAALLREAAHGDVTGPALPSRDELGLPHTPWLCASNVALKVAFILPSCKEERDVMIMIPLFFFPTAHSAPSCSGMPTPCEQSRGLLSCVFLPSPAWSVPLAFLSTSTGQCRTEKSCGSSAFFPEQLVATSFSENGKKVTLTCTRRKMLLRFTLQRRLHRRHQVDVCSHGNHRRVVAGCQRWGCCACPRLGGTPASEEQPVLCRCSLVFLI